MRFIFGIIIYNILAVLLLFYVLFFSSNDIKMQYLKDVSGIMESEAIEILVDYEINIEYVESSKKRQTVLYTKPASNELVYDKQMITLYVSKGFLSKKYDVLENQMYDDCKEYLNNLVKDYKIELIISYEESHTMLDGIIYKQITSDDYIDNLDVVELIVISNPKTIVIPDFIGWHYIDVLKYSKENDVNFIFEYIPILYSKNYVVGQSKCKGYEVLKNSNPITIYLAKEI